MISRKLLEQTTGYFQEHENNPVVVNPSLPILYFGDIEAYHRSDLKIITVGKNPSDNEFRLNQGEAFSFCRFPAWDRNPQNLPASLNPYFRHRPLQQWFSCYEPILNGAEASYYEGNQKNRSIHTDICSPLATSPTWSRISKIDREKLFQEGSNLWRSLVEELNPDIILASLPRNLFDSFFSGSLTNLVTYDLKQDGTPRIRPYKVIIKDYPLKTGKNAIAVWGMPSNKPFDQISNRMRSEIGNMLKRKMPNKSVEATG